MYFLVNNYVKLHLWKVFVDYVQDVQPDMGEWYKDALRRLVDSGQWVEYGESSEWRQVMQGIVMSGNSMAATHHKSIAHFIAYIILNTIFSCFMY